MYDRGNACEVANRLTDYQKQKKWEANGGSCSMFNPDYNLQNCSEIFIRTFIYFTIYIFIYRNILVKRLLYFTLQMFENIYYWLFRKWKKNC